MAEKTEKTEKTEKKTPARAGRATKAPPKVAARAIKAPAKSANAEAEAGDLIRIQESRPCSATKRWRVVEVISRAGEAGAAAPRVADVEKMLEAAEGSGELLVREREEPLGGAAPQAPEEP